MIDTLKICFGISDSSTLGHLLLSIARNAKKEIKTKVTKIKTELIKQPKEGEQYTIEKVEEVTIEIRNNDYDAYRVEMKSSDKKDTSLYTVSLWSGETAGSTSKLGSFIDAFISFFKGDIEKAYETDNWVGHIIQFKTWKDRDREITIIS